MNAYYTKISSGTILALLLLSGFLFIIPLTTSVHAANATSPTVTSLTSNLAGGTSSHWIDFVLTNPSSNQYALTSFVVTAPSGWMITSCDWFSGFFDTCTASNPGQSASYAPGSTGAVIPPGGSQTLEMFVTFASGTYPVIGTFTTQAQDQSSAAYYSGASFKMYSVDPTTTIALTPAGPISFTAGSSPITFTATLSPAQSGVPVIFQDNSGGGAFSVSTGFTGSAGTVTSVYTPVNTAGSVTAEADLGMAGFFALAQQTVNIVAAGPSKVAVTLPGNLATTAPNHYITTEAADALTVNGANVAASAISVSLTDAFGNAVNFAGGDVLTVIASNGRFNSGVTTKTTITCADFGGCPGSGSSFPIPNAYFQSTVYGTLGALSATLLRGSVTYSGLSGSLITSTFDASTNTPTTSPVGAVNAGSTVDVLYSLTTSQKGVPVTFYLDVASTQVNMDGAFTAGGQSYTNTTNSAGLSTAHFALDTGAGASLQFITNVAAPIDGDLTNMLGNSTNSLAVTTHAGPPAELVVLTYFDFGLTQPTKYAVNSAGTTLYVNIALADKYGNPTVSPFNYQLQIALSGPGTFSATSVYIKSSQPDTATSFGPILWHTPTALGAATATATSSIGTGSKTVTIVSPLPTLFVNTVNNSPLVSGSTFYVVSGTVVASGNASASLGYPSSDTIDSICYKLGTGSSGCASIAPANSLPFSAQLNLASGLNTVKFNATDDNGNTVNSATFTILVDSAAPVAGFSTPANANLTGGAPVTAWVYDLEGDLAASSVVVHANGTALASSQVVVSGANNLGHNTTYTVAISGLSTGTWLLTLDASDLAGNAATQVSLTVNVIVPFSASLVISGHPALTTIGGYQGISATYTNQWSTSQSVVVFAVWKNSASQTVAVTAGSMTLAAGASGTAFAPLLAPLPTGSYTVNVFVWTTGNSPVSSTTTITVTV